LFDTWRATNVVYLLTYLLTILHKRLDILPKIYQLFGERGE